MSPEERLTAVCALLIERQVRLEAQTEVILKTQAVFLGKVAQMEWQPILKDLEEQVAESARLRRSVVEQELLRLRGSR